MRLELSSLKRAVRMSVVRAMTWQGSTPTPASTTISAQKNWSPKKGQIMVGLPHRSPMAVVDAPPWWITCRTGAGEEREGGQGWCRRLSGGGRVRV